MSNLLESYNKILLLLHTLDSEDNYRQQIRLPKLSDKQLIALCLAAESQGIDSERYLFKQLPFPLSDQIERSGYNRRRRGLAFKIDDFRQAMGKIIVPEETYHIVDSMPLEVCRLSRAGRSRICQDNVENFPDYGYCDKGYLSHTLQLDLFDTNDLELATPMRKNQKDFKPFPQTFSRARKRIETLFSQLCDQFMIRRNYAKSFDGFKARVASKLTALTLIQWINHREGREINHLKIII